MPLSSPRTHLIYSVLSHEKSGLIHLAAVKE